MRVRLAWLVMGLLAGWLIAAPVRGASAAVPGVTVGAVDIGSFPAVELTSTVTGEDAKPVPHLSADNFDVTQSGVPVRDLQVTEQQTGAVDVVIAIDTSGSQSDYIAESKAEANALVDGLGPDDRVGLVSFDNQTDSAGQLLIDKAAVKAQVDGLQDNPKGNTAFNSALLAAVQLAASGSGPGRAVVVFSDGEEYGNRSLPVEQQVTDLAIAAGVQVYAVYVGDQKPSPLFEEISGATRGQRFDSASDSVPSAISDDVRQSLRSQYVLQFTNGAGASEDPTNLSVQVSAPGSSATTTLDLCVGQSQSCGCRTCSPSRRSAGITIFRRGSCAQTAAQLTV